ncbi:hypothetical protein [Methylophaga sp. OBS4]|uniref:hypothetical protein n=1 Tax=Methylophaga sp. OBS4 TaxID=2991935 RepID=UPI00224F25B7|nr:hypothetical protein [Methylophaga sp. OBS4]MCX4188533.1 hypothetical protein [Methylophaga sp. OBS4]
MTSKKLVALLVTAALSPITPAFAGDIDELKQEIAKMRTDYEQRIQQLEQRLAQAESDTETVSKQMAETQSQLPAATRSNSNNSFNPAISMVLNGQFSDYQNDPDDYAITGFSVPGEGGLAREGLSLGESELVVSANIDQLFYGQATLALHDHESETELELEEAFIETLGLGHGFTLRGGRYFAPIGYLNEKHIHAWNFADAPLIYRGLFGNQLSTDGLKLSYLLPTDFLFEVGASAGNGDSHPGSGEHSGIGDWLIYAKTGGDIGIEHSWQASVSHWQANPDDREYGEGHAHGDEEEAAAVAFNGETDVTNLSLVYKWAPNGNFRQQNLTLLGEFFYLNDDGSLTHEDEFARYDGKQYGGFIEGIYQFTPRWRSGLRYDWLGSKHRASDEELLADADLDITGYHPQRTSAMVEWLPSEFSRVRAQVNHDKSSRDDDWQFLLQYTVSLGAHGAHQF